MKLNDKKYQGSEPPIRKKQVETAVFGEPGLRRIQYASSTSYVLQVQDQGKRRRITLDNPKPRDDFEAVVRARQLKQRLVEGLCLDACMRTFNEIVDGEILPILRARSDSPKNVRYCRDLESRHNSYWRKPLEGTKSEDLTSQRLQRIADNIAPVRTGKATLAPATYNRALAAIKVLCKHMEIRGYVSRNPAKSLQARQENNQRTRILRDDELAAFFSALEAFPLQFRLFIRFLLQTWVRLSEALRAKWVDVSFGQRTLTLPVTKNGRARVVPLSDGALEVLRLLAPLRTNDYLFPGKAAAGHMGRPGRQLRALMEKAGTPGLWAHDLRRSGSTLACRNGASVHDVSAILGHSNVRVTERYIVAHNPRLHTAVQGVDTLINNILSKSEV